MLHKTAHHEPGVPTTAVGHGHHGAPATTHNTSGMRTVRGEHTSGMAPTSGYVEFGQTPASGPAPKTAGPHRHDIANKLDPRVDSSKDHAPVMANPEPHAHKSKLANMLDPRVDSSVANGRHHHAAVGAAGQPHTMHGARTGGAHVGATGPGVATTGHATRSHGAMGAAPVAGTTHAAVPHNSKLMNKLDPRVDSRTGVANTTTGATRY